MQRTQGKESIVIVEVEKQSRFVRVQLESLVVLLRELYTTDKRRVHGPELFIYGGPAVFDSSQGHCYAIRLPCSASEYSIDTPTELLFKLWDDVPERGHLSPLACLCFVLMARHCLSDKGAPVCHAYAYGTVSLRDLNGGADAKLDQTVVPLVDQPALFEYQYASNVMRTRGREKTDPETLNLINMWEGFVARHHVSPADRAVQIFHSPRVATDAHLAVKWNEDVDWDSIPKWNKLKWAYIGNSSLAKSSREFIEDVFAKQKAKTYHPYGGEGKFKKWQAMDSMFSNYFVPVYNTDTGMKIPSGLMQMCVQFDSVPAERLFSNIMRAQLYRFSIKDGHFVDACKHILNIHEQWTTGAVGKNSKERLAFTRFQESCLHAIISALSSLANALSYTTDFAEVRSKQNGTKEVVTEQYETAPLLTLAIDCEDGTGWIGRLWFVWVRYHHYWKDELVAIVGKVLDLYLFRTDVMHCGECHIMAIFKLREAAYRGMTMGAKHLHFKDEGKRIKLHRSVFDTAYWPNWMYAHGHNKRPHRDDVCSTDDLWWPLPPTLYAEPTRASPPRQAPFDVQYVSDDVDGVLYKSETNSMLSNLHLLSGSADRELDQWDSYSTHPRLISRAEASRKKGSLSNFYKVSIVGRYYPPAYKLLQDDLKACQGYDSFETPLLDRYMESVLPFVDLCHHDERQPKTFGVWSSDELSDERSLVTIPYAFLTKEVLLATAVVLGCTAPVLPAVPPPHLADLDITELGRPEPIPQLEKHKHMRSFIDLGKKSNSAHYTVLEYLPKDHVIHGGRLATHLGSSDSSLSSGGVQCMRIPLACSPVVQLETHTEEEIATIQRALKDLHLQDADPSEMLGHIDKTALETIARKHGIYDNYTKQEWDLVRHHIGFLHRTAPVYLKVVRVLSDM